MRTKTFALLTILSICNVNADPIVQDKALIEKAYLLGKTPLEFVLDNLHNRINKILSKRNRHYLDTWSLNRLLEQLGEVIKYAEENEGIDEETREEIDAAVETAEAILNPVFDDGRV